MGFFNPIKYGGPLQDWNTAAVQTLSAGTSFIGLGDIPCDEVAIFIPASGVSIDILSAGQPDATQFVTADAPSGVVLPVAANANEVQVRRNDGSNTPVTVRFTWRKFSK